MSDGWVIAGTAAQFAALLALAAVWWQLADRRRRMRPVFLRFDVVGRREEEGVVVGYLAEIGNSGSGIALIQQIVLVNAEWQLSDDYRPRAALGSGEQVGVLLKANDLAVSWALFVYNVVEDKRFVWVEWRPLAYGNELIEGPPANQSDAKKFKRSRESNVGPVGPGGAVRVRIRTAGKWARYITKLELALTLVQANTSVWAAGTFLARRVNEVAPESW